MSYGVLNDRGLADIDLEALKREYLFLANGYREERIHCEKVMAFNRRLQDEKAAIIKHAGVILAAEEVLLDLLMKEIARADEAEAARDNLRERCADLESRLDLGTGNMYDVVVLENDRLLARVAELVNQCNAINDELRLNEEAVEELQASLFRLSEIEISLRDENETLKETIRDNEAFFMEQKRAAAS